MQSLTRLLTRVALLVLGLSSIASAQQSPADGPFFCPPLDSFLSPTLLDVFLYPGVTFR